GLLRFAAEIDLDVPDVSRAHEAHRLKENIHLGGDLLETDGQAVQDEILFYGRGRSRGGGERGGKNRAEEKLSLRRSHLQEKRRRRSRAIRREGMRRENRRKN